MYIIVYTIQIMIKNRIWGFQMECAIHNDIMVRCPGRPRPWDGIYGMEFL